MNNLTANNYIWREFISSYKKLCNIETNFIRTDDYDALNGLLRHGPETMLLQSVGSYPNPQYEPLCIAPLYFEIHSDDFAKVCNDAKQVFCYLMKKLKLPEHCIEVICSGAFSFVIIIPPVVFGGWPTDLMPEINYNIAHAMYDEGNLLLDLEAYDKKHFLPVPNSQRITRDGYVIRLTGKQLGTQPKNILKLCKKQRPQVYKTMPQRIHQAARYFAEMHKLVEKSRYLRRERYKIMMDKRGGWEVPPCIKKLEEHMPDGLRYKEAIRVITQFLAWIKASRNEINWRIMWLKGNNLCCGLSIKEKITTYALENPGFDCFYNELLREYCPEEGGCFEYIWSELHDKSKNIQKKSVKEV